METKPTHTQRVVAEIFRMVRKRSVLLLLTITATLARTAEVFLKARALLLSLNKSLFCEASFCEVLMVIGGQNFNSTSRGHDHVSQVFF